MAKPSSIAKGFLKESFEAAENYLLFPLPTIKLSWSSITFSKSKFLKSLASIIIISQLMTPMTARLFPTGEDVLKKNGFDPKIAKQLSDRDIRVRDRNIPGYAHAIFDVPTLWGTAQILGMMTAPYNAYAHRGSFLISQCHVFMPPRTKNAEEALSLMTGIPEQRIENLPMTEQEFFATVMFHEFRHCDKANFTTIDPVAEGDADFHAIKTAAETLNNDNIYDVWVYKRALSHSESHNTALYLDAKLNNRSLPSEKLIRWANKEAKEYADIYVKKDDRPSFIRYTEAYRTALKNHRNEMSDLAARRAELYIEATEYFAPSSVKLKKTPKQPVLVRALTS